MITTERLNNGVRIISENMPYVRSLSIGIFVHAGSRDELPKENGLTHFIEHMLFKGTQTRSARQIAEEFDRIGGMSNAYTSKEYTSYHAKVLDHHAEQAAEILADMFFNSLMREEDILKERQVVLEEISMSEDMPDDDVHEQLWKVMYPGHSVGASILGTEETLQSFTREKILDFMERHYTPDRVVISVAGNIQPALIRRIRQLFGGFSRKAIGQPVQMPEFTPGKSIRTRDTEQGHICLGYPGIAIDDQKIYAMAVLNNIAGGTMSSRLFQEIREEHGLAYSVYSYHQAYQDHGTFAVYGGTSNSQLPEMRDRLLDVMDTMVKTGVTASEVSDSKEQLKGSFLLGTEGSGTRMDQNGRNELLLGEHLTDEEVIRRIDSVSDQQVSSLLALLSRQPAVSVIRSE
ncbi:M16 family metallopeptidase [Planococcus lenghuensis]|uniref:Peptidase M16 n=1 Tax=Planococcus lenghuensis TaxID=2213202 RepID=A0A1Q2KZT4_9BACL|nr:pitrilysin family protein [Planococcus lenghuensis]AQQ53710.1 peptidase M16 [Planococcus lenghuensis]